MHAADERHVECSWAHEQSGVGGGPVLAIGGDAENPKSKDSSMDSGKRRDRSKDMYEVAFGFGLVLNGLYGAKL